MIQCIDYDYMAYMKGDVWKKAVNSLRPSDAYMGR